MAKSVFIGFDFSMNKPAATILYDKKFNFFIWPLKLPEKHIQTYKDAGVNVYCRDLDNISEKGGNSQIVLEHTLRSLDLANTIVNTIDDFLLENNIEGEKIYIASEGLSFASKGDAMLNLASYKGVLLVKLYEHFKDKLAGLYTYTPISIKAIADCAKKDMVADKNKMIKAFVKEPLNLKFQQDLLAGKFMAKKNFIACVDDIVDSYWVVKTMLKKENFIK